ncbi:MAG: DeoR/GlpR family DNA-binding transcription regulator [Pelosinus sp.]|nr:DeoR/GlpR family DNA-binding transcription regulator [Pelosinus sp.]
MFAEERHKRILELIKNGKPVKVIELSEMFDVSESTIRRDLQDLDQAGLLQRTHGGAVSSEIGMELSFGDREVQLLEEKRLMAEVAAGLVEDGETVLLDAGTTTLEIAKALRTKKITVATNSMEIVRVFMDSADVEVLVLGGMLRKNIHSLVGPITESIVKRFYFDKVFLAANAVDIEFGATTQNMMEAQTKQTMLTVGKAVYLVTDHSKFGKRCFARICALEDIKGIITDNTIDEELLTTLRGITSVLLPKK